MRSARTSCGQSTDPIRIKVIQDNLSANDSQCCKFSVDPELTKLPVLKNLVARAFEFRGDFQICYLARDERLPQACWLPLHSEFDLEVAFHKSSEPFLLVKAAVSSSSKHSSWESLTNLDISKFTMPDLSRTANSAYSAKLPGLFKEKMEKTLTLVQKAFNWADETDDNISRQKLPLTDAEFQKMLDKVGLLCQPKELRLSVYLGGLEPSLRKVVWKHLLNVYPDGLAGRQRMEYMKQKTQEYMLLKRVWQTHLESANTKMSENINYITSMVKKDVLRTDRHHAFFSGGDDNANVKALYNILTTYALNHPSVGYCQGMSDLASPLLVTMRDEAQAYVCFCALMLRHNANFNINGTAMTLKFQHLTEALIYYDCDFFAYLQIHQADDLLFCYRWLLLELKREFSFDDALHMLEVLWSSLPPSPPKESLPLYEVQFSPILQDQVITPGNNTRTSPNRESHYAHVCALRRQRSSLSHLSADSLAFLMRRRTLSTDSDDSTDSSTSATKSKGLSRAMSQPTVSRRLPPSRGSSLDGNIEENSSLDDENEDSSEVRKIRNLSEFQQLVRNAGDSASSSPCHAKEDKSAGHLTTQASLNDVGNKGKEVKGKNRRCFSDSASDADVVQMYSDGDVDVWQNPVAAEDMPEEHARVTNGVKTCREAIESATSLANWQVALSGVGGEATPLTPTLPPPEEFGGGNPFLMFLCLTLLLQHRQHIVQNNMDHNELAMHFDTLIRQHDVKKVLSQARRMFESYLKLDFSKARQKSTPIIPGQSC